MPAVLTCVSSRCSTAAAARARDLRDDRSGIPLGGKLRARPVKQLTDRIIERRQGCIMTRRQRPQRPTKSEQCGGKVPRPLIESRAGRDPRSDLMPPLLNLQPASGHVLPAGQQGTSASRDSPCCRLSPSRVTV